MIYVENAATAHLQAADALKESESAPAGRAYFLTQGEPGWELMPEARDDRVTWTYEPMDPWRLAFTTGVGPRRVEIDGTVVLDDGVVTTVDPDEIRAKAAEAAQKLFAKLEDMP